MAGSFTSQCVSFWLLFLLTEPVEEHLLLDYNNIFSFEVSLKYAVFFKKYYNTTVFIILAKEGLNLLISLSMVLR